MEAAVAWTTVCRQEDILTGLLRKVTLIGVFAAFSIIFSEL
jgi:hypothetical protein